MSMTVELILDPPAPSFDPDDQATVEPFRRTTWVIWSKGQVLAIAGHAYRNRTDALRSLERVTGGQVQMARETEQSRPQPIALFRPDGEVVPIERVQ